MKLTFVTMKYPCNACIIVQGLLEEIIGKVEKKIDILVERIVIDNPEEIGRVEGLEVEEFPAILINKEQITAGNLITTKDLLLLVESWGDDL